LFVAVSIGVTVPPLTTYAVLPFGVIAIGPGANATGIRFPALLLAASIGVTNARYRFDTYAVLPFGVNAIDPGNGPTLINLPALSVAVLTGVTPGVAPPTLTT
jgi:hypothetical protein